MDREKGCGTMGLFRKNLELILNFVLRGVLGMLLIYFGNSFLGSVQPEMLLGYNLLTFCASGVLGVPGIFMMYGISFYMTNGFW
jgi:inhibitor of the pro-sigma K processing machinery